MIAGKNFKNREFDYQILKNKPSKVPSSFIKSTLTIILDLPLTRQSANSDEAALSVFFILFEEESAKLRTHWCKARLMRVHKAPDRDTFGPIHKSSAPHSTDNGRQWPSSHRSNCSGENTNVHGCPRCAIHLGA